MATTGKKKTQSLEEFFVTEVAVKLWIERVLNVRLPNYFLPELKDGILLCRLMLELRERSIPEIYGFDSSSSSSSSSSDSSQGQELPFYLTKNNIQFFLAACEEEFHLSKSVLLPRPFFLSLDSDRCARRHQLFGVFDLSRLQNEARVVYCLKHLSDCLVTDSSWTGPVFVFSPSSSSSFSSSSSSSSSI